MLRVNNSPSVQVPFRKRLLLIPGLKTSVLEGVGLGGREGVWEVDERECGVEMSEAREEERRFKQMPPSLFPILLIPIPPESLINFSPCLSSVRFVSCSCSVLEAK